jgi:C4-dicarboxylate transporter DctM subunit
MNDTLLLFLLFAAFVVINVPIAISLGMAAVVVGYLMQGNFSFVASIMLSALQKVELLAIPFFILAGNVFDRCGIMNRLFSLMDSLIGPMRGGTAIVTSAVAVLFGGISGSGPADTAALGSTLAPVMNQRGYSKGFTASLISAGGSLGLVVPPSIAFILYGVVVPGISIGRMFIAGILPGLLMGVALAGVSYVISVRRGYEGQGKRETGLGFFANLTGSFWGLMAPLVIIGGIYLGVFTPTEAAGAAVVYGVLVGWVVYREITWRELLAIARVTIVDSAVVMLIISSASLFSWILTVDGTVVSLVGDFSAGIHSQWQVFAMAGLVLLGAGLFIDGASIYLVLVPLLIPPAQAQGIDLTWFGVFIAVAIAIGQFTPPVGVNLFVATRVVGIEFDDLLGEIWPFFLASLAALLIVYWFPFLSTWLPSTMPSLG